MYITRLTSNEIFSLSNKIHREVGRAKDLSAPARMRKDVNRSCKLVLCEFKEIREDDNSLFVVERFLKELHNIFNYRSVLLNRVRDSTVGISVVNRLWS
jgi:hypothetical protein